MAKKAALFINLILFIFIIAASPCPAGVQFTPAAQIIDEEEPVLITGSFEYSNDFVVEIYYVEHAVGLIDLTGFVLRDMEWEVPVDGQVLGYMDLDAENDRATYTLSLPAVPLGAFNDVDNDTVSEQGLQIFAVAYNPNLTGGVFSEGDDRSLGWPAYLASIRTDSENKDEIIGGKLVIWAADDGQEFPSGWGSDGLLFSADDPTAPVPAGYSIVDLDSDPFTFSREANPDLTLYEPEDIKVKDYSNLSFMESFDSMFEVIRREYAFNGVAHSWDYGFSNRKSNIWCFCLQGNCHLGCYEWCLCCQGNSHLWHRICKGFYNGPKLSRKLIYNNWYSICQSTDQWPNIINHRLPKDRNGGNNVFNQ